MGRGGDICIQVLFALIRTRVARLEVKSFSSVKKTRVSITLPSNNFRTIWLHNHIMHTQIYLHLFSFISKCPVDESSERGLYDRKWLHGCVRGIFWKHLAKTDFLWGRLVLLQIGICCDAYVHTYAYVRLRLRLPIYCFTSCSIQSFDLFFFYNLFFLTLNLQ